MIYEITNLIIAIYGIIGIIMNFPYYHVAIGYALASAILMSIERIYKDIRRVNENENENENEN